MIVWCDTYDHSDYPAYYRSKELAQKAFHKPGSMQRVMEVYTLDPEYKTWQICQSRCYCWEVPQLSQAVDRTTTLLKKARKLAEEHSEGFELELLFDMAKHLRQDIKKEGSDVQM